MSLSRYLKNLSPEVQEKPIRHSRTPEQIEAAANPSPTSPRGVGPRTPEAASLFANTVENDADVCCYRGKFKTTSWLLRRPRIVTVSIFQTHQRIFPIPNAGTQMAAFLAFRLEITNRKPPKLQLTVHLPDPMYPFLRRDHTELEIAHVYPYRTTTKHQAIAVQHTDSHETLTLMKGSSGLLPFSGFNIAVSPESAKAWEQTDEVVCTEFEGESPRGMFAMTFSSLPGSKQLPDVLAFAILITFQKKAAPFTLEFGIEHDGMALGQRAKCDGKTQFGKSVDPIL